VALSYVCGQDDKNAVTLWKDSEYCLEDVFGGVKAFEKNHVVDANTEAFQSKWCKMDQA
jgi:hypothetical protein